MLEHNSPLQLREQVSDARFEVNPGWLGGLLLCLCYFAASAADHHGRAAGAALTGEPTDVNARMGKNSII